MNTQNTYTQEKKDEIFLVAPLIFSNLNENLDSKTIFFASFIKNQDIFFFDFSSLLRFKKN